MFEKGVYTVLVTPYENNKISYNCLDNLVERQINKGIEGIITLGTTSESPTISMEEKKDLVQYLWNKYNESINIIIGIGGNDTNSTIEFGQFCSDYCHGMMVTVPNYNKPSQEGIFSHFSTIANSDKIINKPLMLYNIPSRCCVNMEADTIIALYQSCDNIVAIKEASGSIEQTIKIKQNCNINIFSGDDALVIPLMSVGAVGVISVTSNLIPEYIVDIVNLCNNNNFNFAREKYFKIHDLIKSLFIETNPTPLKYLLQKINIIKSDEVRLPLTKITNPENIYILDKQIEEVIKNTNKIQILNTNN